jgi:hypothetical protein
MPSRKMASLRVVNKAGEVLADGVTADTFTRSRKEWGKGCAVLVQLDCGQELLVDTAKLMRRLPKGAEYTARLMQRIPRPPKNIDCEGHAVWVEA